MTFGKKAIPFFVAVVTTAFLGATAPGAQDLATNWDRSVIEPVIDHDWKSQTKLGLQYVFAPYKAAQAQVYRIYDVEDLPEALWNEASLAPTFDLIVTPVDTHKGFILKELDVVQLFDTAKKYQDFQQILQKQGLTINFASLDKVTGLDVEPAFMVIHRSGLAPEDVGIEAATAKKIRHLAVASQGESMPLPRIYKTPLYEPQKPQTD